MNANMFQSKRRSFTERKAAQWMRQLISLPEKASLKFLMPSRRHHPQVEPLLATYKICYIKRWLKHFWSLQGKKFIAKSVGSWRLLKASCLCPNIHCCSLFYILRISAVSISKNTAAKSSFFPFLHSKLAFICSPFSP